MQEEGSLRRGPGQPRTIVQPAGSELPPAGDVAEVPIVGQIAAGFGQEAVELTEEMFRLPWRLVGHGTLFMLRVEGDSMTGAAITDGDLVVVRRQQVAENGEIVAALLNEDWPAEATVKTLQRLKGHAWLMPCNPAYQPVPADDVVILGGTGRPGAATDHRRRPPRSPCEAAPPTRDRRCWRVLVTGFGGRGSSRAGIAGPGPPQVPPGVPATVPVKPPGRPCISVPGTCGGLCHSQAGDALREMKRLADAALAEDATLDGIDHGRHAGDRHEFRRPDAPEARSRPHRSAHGQAHALARRLRQRHDDLLRFTNPLVPFDNTAAELPTAAASLGRSWAQDPDFRVQLGETGPGVTASSALTWRARALRASLEPLMPLLRNARRETGLPDATSRLAASRARSASG
jgi:SOS regulatory protein LexA